MIHALKPNPQNNLAEPWRWLDFFSLRNESLHMLTFLLDDGGIPANYRCVCWVEQELQ
jgi:catalase